MNREYEITNRLDSLAFSRWHIVVVLAIGVIWVFDGYEVSLISLFSSYILNQFSSAQYKLLATAYQLGCIIGSLTFGVITFYHGRKPIFMITLAIYALGIVMCMAGNKIEVFLLGRVLTGLAVGGEFTAIFSAIDEFLPPTVRGRVDIIVDGSWHLGAFIGALFNFLLGQVEYWRLLFGLGFLGILAVGIIRRNIPESPRWLIMKGRSTEAEEVVRGIQNCIRSNRAFLNPHPSSPNIQAQEQGYKDFNNCLGSERQSKLKSQKINQNEGGPDLNHTIAIDEQIIDDKIKNKVSECKQTSSDGADPENDFDIARSPSQFLLQQLGNIAKFYKRRLFLSCFLIFAQAFFFNLVYYQFPIFLKEKYQLNLREVSGYMMPLSVCAFTGTLLVGPFFDTIGRRAMLLFSYCGAGALLIFTQFFDFGLGVLLVSTYAMFILGSPAGSSANLIASELFPTSTRPIVLSVIFMVGMFGGMCGIWANSHLISGILMGVAGILGWFMCPNAQGRSLEQINNMGQNNPIKKIQ